MIEYNSLIGNLYLYTNLALFGLIWTVQIVHYPSFRYIDKKRYFEFQEFHMKRISYVVMPLMLIELLSGSILLMHNLDDLYFILSFVCLVIIWAWTFFVNVPIHSKLMKSYEAKQLDKLILSNWPRTILWTVKLFLINRA